MTMGLKLSGDTLQDWDLEEILGPAQQCEDIKKMFERLEIFEMFNDRPLKDYYAGMKLWDK